MIAETAPPNDDMTLKTAITALELAAEHPWKSVSLRAVADKAGLDFADLYGVVTRASLLDAIDAHFDRTCAAEAPDMEDSVRERIFDVTLLRFEAMEPHRAGVLSIRDSWRTSPTGRLAAARRRARSAAWILTCAGMDGPGFKARTALMTGILTRAEWAWVKEDSPDFTRTMAQLDRDLRDVSQFAKRFKMGRKKQSNEANDTPESDTDLAPDPQS